MLQTLTQIVFLLISFYVFSQNELKVFEPYRSLSTDLNKNTENEINRQNELLQKEYLSDEETRELDALIHKYGEVVESMWDVIDGGCSWYCGGGNYEVIASSHLE